MKIEPIYPLHVTVHRDFLLAEIQRIEQRAQCELEELARGGISPPPRVIETKRREVLRQTQPLHDELTRILSLTTCNYLLSRDSVL